MEEKMIERQSLKLKLDTMIIQKGRLAPKQTGFQKDEMREMLNYGADAIFTIGSNVNDK
jgi:calcineurin-like phosphoesterase